MDVIGFESHDNGLSLEALEAGFYVSNMLAVCRTGEDLGFPTEEAQGYRVLKARGFVWYDTWQEHIITDSTFRSCGYNTDQNDDFGRGGCDESTPNNNGCDSSSAVFGFLTHSDEFNPEIMQATRGLTFENCGRRFRFSHEDRDSVSGRSQNWLDADGTASNMPGQPILIGSGLDSVIDWWKVDDQCMLSVRASYLLHAVFRCSHLVGQPSTSQTLASFSSRRIMAQTETLVTCCFVGMIRCTIRLGRPCA